jgi:hypothetical protein
MIDPDGEEFNKVTVALDGVSILRFEVDNFFGSCKYESGLMHALVRIEHAPFVCCESWIESNGVESPTGRAFVLTFGEQLQLPVSFGGEEELYFGVSNLGSLSSRISCSLSVDSRTVQAIRTVPGLGSRFFSMQAEFGKLKNSLIGGSFIELVGLTLGTSLLVQPLFSNSQKTLSGIYDLV